VSDRTAFRVCPLCEATCGLELAVRDDVIVRVRGDREHVFSKGFLCPKGAAFDKLVADPDRLTRPMVRDGNGWREVTWDEAFAAVADGLRRVVDEHGPESVATYLGNPVAHTMAGALYAAPLLRALRSRSRFTASSVDQMPKHVACGEMYGSLTAIPVPDVDHTDLLVILGADPWSSNGSLCTAPDFPGRLKALQARGGRFVVVDPRRSRTAVEADEHLAIRPGTDALLLFALVHTLFDEDLVDLGHLAPHVVGVDDVRVLASAFAPVVVARATGIDGDAIRRLARDLAAAPSAAVYGRIGTCTVAFGTLASWLVDVLNVLTGNLDRPGGALFPLGAHQRADRDPGGPGFTTGRWRSRVRGLPEVAGELPVAALAEEIETEGAGQIRALLTVGGNPALSTPNSARLDAALATLDFMVSVDPYLNETTRHAHVILPPTDAARVGHYDFNFSTLAIRNTATYSPPALPPDPGALDEADILARLTLIAQGRPEAEAIEHHEQLLRTLLQRAVEDDRSAVAGCDVDELRAQVQGDAPTERLLDAMVRLGAYGDGFGASPDGLSLQTLLAHPHGIDLGPLRPRLPAMLRTPSGKVELCPAPFAADVPRLQRSIDDIADGLVLIGRRQLRSNNSWMHNVHVLVKGKDRCTLQVHPDDAARNGVLDGGTAIVASRVGEVRATVEVTDEVRPGVVSLPHGWGHGVEGTRMAVAAAHPGVNSNVLTDECEIDPLSGNAVLNAIPVTLRPG
jgi:anaerobic selenocysteine-containing dehydrogenase